MSLPGLTSFDIIFRLDNYRIGLNMTSLTHVAENIFDLRKIDRVIGFYLYDKLNEPIAKTDAALVDSRTYHCYYLVINLGGFFR